MPPSPDPVWIIFRRRTFSRLAYWSLVLGFDVRDRSLTNRFYFIYFILFWAAWVIAIFALLGYTLSGVFESLAVTSPSALAALLFASMFAVWGLVQLWQVTGRSPFVFSEPDAFLLCQAPISRRSVGVAWFLMDWFGSVLPFAAVAIMFSFALTETALPRLVSVLDLLAYFTDSLRALAVVLPLQMGLQAGLWGLGALRLRRDRPPWGRRWLRLVVPPFVLALMAAIILPNCRAIILAPLVFPLQAAFNQSLFQLVWFFWVIYGLLVLALGSAILIFWSGRMHLGRAAQETRLQSIIRLSRGALNFELADILQRRDRMKATRPPSSLPVRGGAWIMVWKDSIQSWRSMRVSQVLRWIWVFFLGLGIFLAPAWEVQLVIGVIWAVSLGALATKRLRSDLARWWLLRSLPVRDSNLLLAQLGPACVLGISLSWLALIVVHPPLPFVWLAAALLPFLVVIAALASARDILDHAKARVLMTPALAEENVPSQDIQGVLTILVSVGIPLGLLAWGRFHLGGLVWELLSLPAAVLISILVFQSVRSVYRWIM